MMYIVILTGYDTLCTCDSSRIIKFENEQVSSFFSTVPARRTRTTVKKKNWKKTHH